MAKKNGKEEKDILEGFPEHGDPIDDSPDDELDQDDENDEDEDDKVPPKPPGESIEERLARLEGENAAMRATITRQPAQEPAKPKPEPEPDWDTVMYDNPGEFVKLLTKKITTQVTTDLSTKYQKDQGEKEFWNEFYVENKDLKEDKDLVQAVLQGNIAQLGDLPVSQAKKKLADLTRERIVRYTGNRPKDDADKGKKVRVEGARSPAAPEKKVENKIVTLSDIIKSRRALRAKAKTA